MAIAGDPSGMEKVCIVGASGKLGQYLVDFALFMIEALRNDELVHEAPAIVGRQTPSALAQSGGLDGIRAA